MNWFERHLNWSLFFGTSLLPLVVNMIFGAVLFAMFWGQLAPLAGSGMDGLSEETLTSMFLDNMPLIIIFSLVGLVLFGFAVFVAWWYLGQKARSKWFLLLFLGPGVLVGIFENSNIIIRLLILLIALVCIIVFYRLENKKISYGGDFVSEPVADRWPDTGQFSAPENWQTKELDYSPAKDAQDIAYGGDVKDVRDVGIPGGEVPAAVPPEVPPEVPVKAPSAAADIQEEVTAEVIAEANEESLSEAVTAAQVTEEAVRHETLNTPILLDDAGVVIKCFYHPDADAVNLCSRCRQYVCSQCNYVTGTHPICRNCWEKRAETPILPVSSEAQKGVKLSKSEKRKAEESERLREFMQLYEQALPVISAVIKKGADGLPASPFDLMEWLKLRPMLEHVKKLSKPKEKELHEAKKEFEQLLLACIKVAEAAELVTAGGQAIPSEADLARLDAGIATANGLMERLSQRLAALSQSPGD